MKQWHEDSPTIDDAKLSNRIFTIHRFKHIDLICVLNLLCGIKERLC